MIKNSRLSKESVIFIRLSIQSLRPNFTITNRKMGNQLTSPTDKSKWACSSKISKTTRRISYRSKLLCNFKRKKRSELRGTVGGRKSLCAKCS